mgnify:FL=1|tara:strand:+ start:48 stop:404 length:357 start_codon:yes stop_codon:yes gene_type:complete
MKPSKKQFLAELSKQRPTKINLALAQDIEQKAEEVSVYSDNVSISTETLKEVQNSLEVDLADLVSNSSDLKQLLTDAEQVSSEIGVDVNDIPNYLEAKQTLEFAVEQIKNADSIGLPF